MVFTQKISFIKLIKNCLVSTVFLSALCFYLSTTAWGQAEEDNLLKQQNAIIAPLASKSLLVDISQVNKRWVIAGERGHILYSDNGEDWKQAITPTQNMITGLFFVNDNQGWAVGHDSVILYTQDRGASWSLQFSAPENEAPLMDVLFLDNKRGMAVGAYGLYLVTQDGGLNWAPQTVDAEMDRHLNALFKFNDDLFIAGESGILYRSEDQGDSWQQMEFPYQGSLFGMSSLSNTELLAFGLRGTAFSSNDRGQTWQQLSIPVKATLMGHAMLENGCSGFAGTGGTLLMKCPNQSDYQQIDYPNFNDLVGVAFYEQGKVLLVGEKGVEIFTYH